MNIKYLPDLLGENTQLIFCGLNPDKDSLMMQHYYASPHDKFWHVLHQFNFTDRQIKTSLNPEAREANYDYLKSKKIALVDDLSKLIDLVKEFKPKALAFNGKKVAEIYFGKEVEYGEQKNVRIGKTKIFVLPSSAGSANAFWNIRYWRELSNLIKK